MMKVTAYYVNSCKVSKTKDFEGYVFCFGDENITNGIKRKLGVDNLLCERTGEAIDYDSVSFYSVPLNQIALGDLLVILGKFDPPTE